MRTTLLILFIVLGFAFVLQLAPAWAFTTDQQEDICATAAVVACENFENRAVGIAKDVLGSAKFKNIGWGVSDTGMTVVSSQFFDGNKSLQWFFPANKSAGYLRLGFAPARSYYMRWYMKNSADWVWSANGNKMVFVLGPVDRLVMLDQGIFGGDFPVMDALFQTPNIGWHYPNMGPEFHWPLNQWVCMEIHLSMNSTLNSTDGLFEGWINGVQRYNYPGINISTKDTLIRDIMPSGFWNCKSGIYDPATGFCQISDPANNHPDMERWMDNIVVSTARIGCLGAPITGDTAPPSAPVGLTIR